MSPEEAKTELDRLLTDEQTAIRALDANLAIAYADKKVELFRALAAAAETDAGLRDDLVVFIRRARQNAMLLAFARDCIRDAMGTVAHHLNTRVDVTRAPTSALRKGVRLSVTG